MSDIDWAEVRSGTIVEVSNYPDFRKSSVHKARYIGYNEKSLRCPHVAYAVDEGPKYKTWMYARACSDSKIDIMHQKEYSDLVTKSKQIMVEIGKKRDELRSIKDELDDFLASSDEGLVELESAIVTLSQYV